MSSSLPVRVGDLERDGILAPLQDGNHAERHPGPADFAPAGVPFIRAGDLPRGWLDLARCAFLRPDCVRSLRTGFARSGDVLLTHKGTVGRSAVVPAGADLIVLSPQVTRYRVADPGRLHNGYLKYVFLSPLFQCQLHAGAEQSTRKYVGLAAQRRLWLPLPPIAEQRAIAGLLAPFDDRIQVGERINATLEALVEALFLDHVGSGPRGRLADLADAHVKRMKPADFPDEVFDHYSIPALDEGQLLRSEPGAAIRSHKLLVGLDSVLVSKLNPHIPRVCLPRHGPLRRICSTEFVVLTARWPATREYLYALLQSDAVQTQLRRCAGGTSASHQRVHAGDLLRMPCVLPSAGGAARFSDLVRPLLAQIDANREQALSLIGLRETLLARLISGEETRCTIQPGSRPGRRRASMDRATFLTRVVLENYKSIAHCDVRLGPLNYLVGPNGAGKSNFLDALRFVADVLKHSVGEALRSRGGGGAICHAGNKRQGQFSIHLEFPGPGEAVGQYFLKVGQANEGPGPGQWEFMEESLGPPTQPGDTGLSLDERVFREGYDALKRMRFYSIRPRNIEDVSTFDPWPFLTPDGSNLPSVFFRLGVSSSEVIERINEHLRLILPGLVKVRAEPVMIQGADLTVETFDAPPKVALVFEQRCHGRVHRFWSSQMSEGTLRTLGILTALLQATANNGPRPSLVAIEEPEAQIHPAALAVLRDAMVEASYSTQVLVTTHSADILDSKDVDTDSILAVTADEGATRIAPINAAGRDLIRQRLYTPGELMRIGQLFPEQGRNGDEASQKQPSAVGGTP
jgi:predicted ATPase